MKINASKLAYQAEQKCNNFILSTRNKVAAGIAAFGLASPTVQAFAAGGKMNTKADGENLIKTILDIIVGIFPWVGGFFVVFGGFKLFMALRNDGNPDAVTTAAKDIIIGVVMFIFGTLFWTPISNLLFGAA